MVGQSIALDAEDDDDDILKHDDDDVNLLLLKKVFLLLLFEVNADTTADDDFKLPLLEARSTANLLINFMACMTVWVCGYLSGSFFLGGDERFLGKKSAI